MVATVLHHQAVGDGWHLSLSSQPPEPAPFQLVAVLDGRGRWTSPEREHILEPSVPWWSSAGAHQRWTAEGPSRWLSLASELCPWASAQEEGARCCAAAVADVRELAAIVTDCPYPCELKDLLTRGKSLMLVSKALATLAEPPAGDRYAVRFFQDDLDRVREARKILLDRMEDPPTLPVLARLVGLNEVKLKAGFRRLWGTTVYGLLRQERLAEARRFLLAGAGNVGEAAFRVGYTNTSHFAEAFQKEFGLTPGAVLRSRN